MFWPLSSGKVLGILNALPMAESLAQLVEDAGPDGKARALEVMSGQVTDGSVI